MRAIRACAKRSSIRASAGAHPDAHARRCGAGAKALRAEERYDITIDLQGLMRSALMTWAANSPNAALGLMSAREGSRAVYNEYIAGHRPLRRRALPHLPWSTSRFPSSRSISSSSPRAPLPGALKRTSAPYIALHPYSRWRTKLWPWRYYQELVNAMPDYKFVVVGRGALVPARSRQAKLIDLRGQLGIGTLVTVLNRARRPSSAPIRARLTSPERLGRPTLVLFGATDWRKTKPSGSHGHGAHPCSLLLPLSKTDLLARFADGVHESAYAAKDPNGITVNCAIKANSSNAYAYANDGYFNGLAKLILSRV